jgi:hypothetical protein
VLIAWSARFAQAFVWITGARPIARADLESRFATVVAATAIHPPRLLRFGFPGGRLVNAFALPSLRRSTHGATGCSGSGARGGRPHAGSREPRRLGKRCTGATARSVQSR